MDPITWITLAVALLIIILIYYLLNQDGSISELENKCVVITGCDSGFGHELALVLDSQGLGVFACCLTERGENALKSKSSPRLKTIKMDVTNSEDIERCLDLVRNFVESTNGVVLWAVVNNAGIGSPGPIEWTPMKDLKRVFDVNVWGMLEVTKAFLPLVKKSRGRIINVASAAGKVPMPGGHTISLLQAMSQGTLSLKETAKFLINGAGAYSSSKFAVQCFTDVLRNELRPFGVTVHTIDPGFFKTNLTDYRMQKQIMERLWNNLSQETRDEYGQDFCDKGMKIMEKMTSIASRDIHQVIRAMVHAIISTHPKIRYIVGWDHKLLWRWLALLPSGVQDFVLGSSYPKPKAAKV